MRVLAVAILCAAAVAGLNCPAAALTAPASIVQTHIIYHLWFSSDDKDGGWAQWNHKVQEHWDPQISRQYPRGVRYRPPDDLCSHFYPELGPYSSSNASVVHEHMRQISSTGIGLVVVPWALSTAEVKELHRHSVAHPEGLRNVDERVQMLLNAAEAHELAVTFFLAAPTPWKAETSHQRLSYILNSYSEHPAFYRLPGDGRSLIFVMDTHRYSPEQLRGFVTAFNSRAALMGTHVNEDDGRVLAETGFFGFISYFANERISYASNSSRWKELVAQARDLDLVSVLSVSPGYDDSRIRPWNHGSALTRKKGQRYSSQWDLARAAAPDAVSVTSWNNFCEGTQIEGVQPMSIPPHESCGESRRAHRICSALAERLHLSNDYRTYEEGPAHYVDLTKRHVQSFSSSMDTEAEVEVEVVAAPMP